MISPSTLMLNWMLALPFFGAVAAELFPRFTLGKRILGGQALTGQAEREAQELARGPFLLGGLICAMGLSLAVGMTALVMRGETPAADYLWTRDLYHLRLQADALSAVAALLVFGIGLVVFVHLGAVEATRQALGGQALQRAGGQAHHRAALILAAVGGLVGCVLAADVILLVFCLGMGVMAVGGLIATQARERGEAMLLNGYLAWLPVLLAALWMWRQAGDASTTQLGLLLLVRPPSVLQGAALLAVSGLLPLTAGVPGYGRWGAVVRAAPAEAGIGAALLVIGGSMALLRLLPGALVLPAVPGLGKVSLAAGLVVLWWGALRSWLADDLRGRVAWLTVAQSGYLLLALAGAAGPTAPSAFLRAAGLHVVAAPVAVAALWLASLAVLARFGTDSLVGLSGLLRKMPAAGMAFLVSGLSLVGLPPLAGYRAQSLLVRAWEAERGWPVAAAILAADLVMGYVVLDGFRRVFLRGAPPPEARNGLLGSSACLLALTALLVVGGVWARPLAQWSDLAYSTVLSLRPTP